MNNDLLHVLVDSREASVTFARIFYRKTAQFDLGVIEHIRPRYFVDHFQAVLSEVLPQDCRNSQLMAA